MLNVACYSASTFGYKKKSGWHPLWVKHLNWLSSLLFIGIIKSGDIHIQHTHTAAGHRQPKSMRYVAHLADIRTKCHNDLYEHI